MARNQTHDELKQRVKVLEKEAGNRKRAEEALQESEDRYRSILETAPHSITITRVKDGRYLQVNEAFCQMRGYSREEVLGRAPFELNLYVNPEDRERIIKILKEKGEVNGFEVQYQKRDGTAIDTLFSARPLEYENEDCLIAVVTDVTELKGEQEALKKRLAYEKMLTDISTRAILIEDISRCLDECLEIMGKTLHVCRIYIFEYHHGPGTADNTFEWVSDGIAPQKENLQGLSMKKYPWWMEMLNNNKIINYQDIEDIPGGPEKELLRSQSIKSILVVPLFVNNAFYGFMGFDECLYHRKWLNEDVDILKTTAQIISNAFESKHAEETLRASEGKYRALFETAQDAIFLSDERGRFLDVNHAACESLGYLKEELLELHNKDIDADPSGYEAFMKVRDGLVDHMRFDVDQRRKDGTLLPVEITGCFFTSGGQRISLAIARDITERKRSEDAMRESEKKYRDLVENISDVIYTIDTDGVMTYISPAIESIFGYSPSEIIGKPLIEFVYKDDLTRMRKRFEETLSGHIKPSEYRFLSKSGEIHWILASSKPVFVENHVIGIQGVLTDNTERKRAEIALQEKEQKLERQTQRLEEVNTALKVLLEHREEEKKKSEENILSNVQKLIFPYIEKLENSRLDDKNKTYVDIIRSNLKELISPFANTLSSKYAILTSTEIQVADLIKHGRTSKEIASLLNVSIKAVSFHRGNIRKKLGLVNKKINLRSNLQSLAT
ncbi:MAG: PAS domain S-box protein [Desulfobacterales bacterium]|nr:PAS domain S-box protein [Desulfobacterales bacterium]